MRDGGDRQRLAALTTVGLGRTASLLVSAAMVDENGERFGEFFTGVSIRAFGNSTLNVSAHSRDEVNTVSAELQQPTPVGTGWGYRLQTSGGSTDTLSHASVQYQND